MCHFSRSYCYTGQPGVHWSTDGEK